MKQLEPVAHDHRHLPRQRQKWFEGIGATTPCAAYVVRPIADRIHMPSIQMDGATMARGSIRVNATVNIMVTASQAFDAIINSTL